MKRSKDRDSDFTRREKMTKMHFNEPGNAHSVPIALLLFSVEAFPGSQLLRARMHG